MNTILFIWSTYIGIAITVYVRDSNIFYFSITQTGMSNALGPSTSSKRHWSGFDARWSGLSFVMVPVSTPFSVLPLSIASDLHPGVTTLLLLYMTVIGAVCLLSTLKAAVSSTVKAAPTEAIEYSDLTYRPLQKISFSLWQIHDNFFFLMKTENNWSGIKRSIRRQ